MDEISENGFSHGDIRPWNILYDGSKFSLIDMGSIVFHDRPPKDVDNRPGLYSLFLRNYYKPCRLIDDKIPPRDIWIRNDLWGLGLVIYNLYKGNMPNEIANHLKYAYTECRINTEDTFIDNFVNNTLLNPEIAYIELEDVLILLGLKLERF